MLLTYFLVPLWCPRGVWVQKWHCLSFPGSQHRPQGVSVGSRDLKCDSPVEFREARCGVHVAFGGWEPSVPGVNRGLRFL